MRLLHTADWQLGKPFTGMTGDIGAHLRKARFDTVERLAELANDRNCDAILVAGDCFDSPFPDKATLFSALNAMKRFKGPWVLLPGNHDPADGNDLWNQLANMGQGVDLHLALDPQPIVLADGGLTILPAPLRQRHGFDDPTAWMNDVQTSTASLRIGLAHGSVREFGSQTPSPNLIAIDRAAIANLDYLALGDWHGWTKIDGRTFYSGTPEIDDFPSNEPGFVGLVDVDAPGSVPKIERVRVTHYDWRRLEIKNAIDLSDIVAQTERLIGDAERVDRLLVSLTLDGRIDLSGRMALAQMTTQWQARLAHLRLNDQLLDEPSDEDRAALARGSGMVAETARRLIERGDDDARLALRHLYDLAMRADA